MRIYLLSFLLLILSCSQNKQETSADNTEVSQEVVLSKEAIASLRLTEYVLDAKAEKTLSTWQKYNELEGLVSDVKNVDLTFFKDNKEVLKSFLDDLKSTIPESINTPAIQARLKIVETMGYKLEDQVMLSQPKQADVLVAIKSFLEAVSNLNFQINKKLERDSQKIQKP